MRNASLYANCDSRDLPRRIIRRADRLSRAFAAPHSASFGCAFRNARAERLQRRAAINGAKVSAARVRRRRKRSSDCQTLERQSRGQSSLGTLMRDDDERRRWRTLAISQHNTRPGRSQAADWMLRTGCSRWWCYLGTRMLTRIRARYRSGDRERWIKTALALMRTLRNAARDDALSMASGAKESPREWMGR